MPRMTSFIAEWDLSPEGWPTKHGRDLRQRASVFAAIAPRADGYGARLLALPLVEAAAADEIWRKFWGTTGTLREIIEFGDSDSVDDGGWQGRSEASRLLMLQFSIGLMMMDHLLLPQRPLNYDRGVALNSLLPLLDEALREMIAIDQLNGKFWTEAVRHLAVRRAKWDSTYEIQGGTAFAVETTPTMVDFLRAIDGDTENLLALAYVALRNGVSEATLAVAFTDAQIDIHAELKIAEHLRTLSPKAIGLDKEQLDIIWQALAASQ
jgi:hypothetical protein